MRTLILIFSIILVIALGLGFFFIAFQPMSLEVVSKCDGIDQRFSEELINESIVSSYEYIGCKSNMGLFGAANPPILMVQKQSSMDIDKSKWCKILQRLDVYKASFSMEGVKRITSTTPKGYERVTPVYPDIVEELYLSDCD